MKKYTSLVLTIFFTLFFFNTYLQANPVEDESIIRNNYIKCWSIPMGIEYDSQMIVKVLIKLNKDGSISEPPEVVDSERMNKPSEKHFKILAESALRAVRRCNPIKGLNEENHEYWKEVILNFDPRILLDSDCNISIKRNEYYCHQWGFDNITQFEDPESLVNVDFDKYCFRIGEEYRRLFKYKTTWSNCYEGNIINSAKMFLEHCEEIKNEPWLNEPYCIEHIPGYQTVKVDKEVQRSRGGR